jgi:hypothetical protein
VKLLHDGEQTVTLSADEARRYIADPRFKLMDPTTGRRVTVAQAEASIRASRLKERIGKLQVQLQCEADDYKRLLNFWKPLPEIAYVDDWKKALAKRPFESKLPPPIPPNFELERIALLSELTAKHHSKGIDKFLPEFVARNAAQKEMEIAWPEHQTRVQSQFDERSRQYHEQLASESAAWDEAESELTGWKNCLPAIWKRSITRWRNSCRRCAFHSRRNAIIS